MYSHIPMKTFKRSNIIITRRQTFSLMIRLTITAIHFLIFIPNQKNKILQKNVKIVTMQEFKTHHHWDGAWCFL